WVADKIAAREIAQLPRAAFSVTGRQILGWIGFYGYAISDWPPARRSLTTSPPHGTSSDTREGPTDRRLRWGGARLGSHARAGVWKGPTPTGVSRASP
ncbi:MAG: hypothetical protein ACLP8S_12480, partial [Solirubrobacteraceae bacterium]